VLHKNLNGFHRVEGVPSHTSLFFTPEKTPTCVLPSLAPLEDGTDEELQSHRLKTKNESFEVNDGTRVEGRLDPVSHHTLSILPSSHHPSLTREREREREIILKEYGFQNSFAFYYTITSLGTTQYPVSTSGQ
jgi:hypothetical protein